MKKLMNLKGVKTLSKKEQQSISGGAKFPFCRTDMDCPSDSQCVQRYCT